jgi:hypothetical protein
MSARRLYEETSYHVFPGVISVITDTPTGAPVLTPDRGFFWTGRKRVFRKSEEAEILAMIATRTGGEPYREVALATLSPEDLEVLTSEVMERLLDHYVDAERVDLPAA